jgi:uncharacterized membrane protein YccF (DUF307 family)
MAGTIARILWFLVVGWWLGPIWAITGLLLMATVIGAPLGAWFLATTGYATALAPQRGVNIDIDNSVGGD